jgi:hypothetical protein
MKILLQDRVQQTEWDYIKNLPYLIFGYVARSEAKEEDNSPVKGVILWSIHNVSMKEFRFQMALRSPIGEKGSYFVELFQNAWDRENFYFLTEDAVEDALDPYQDGEDEKLTGIVNILKRELNEHEYDHFCVELFTFIIELGGVFNEHPEDQMENLFSQQECDFRLLQRIFNFC